LSIINSSGLVGTGSSDSGPMDVFSVFDVLPARIAARELDRSHGVLVFAVNRSTIYGIIKNREYILVPRDIQKTTWSPQYIISKKMLAFQFDRAILNGLSCFIQPL
jgi:hypothetical protein